MKPESASALVLSAGFSERMGDFKPMMMLGEMTILDRLIRLFQSIGVNRIHVVIGHRAAELAPLIRRWGARGVMNARYAEGMFSSVVAGVSSLDAETEAFFVLPVDIPLVRPATLRELLRALPDGGLAICHPTFGGRRGHPPLIGGLHIRSILEWRRGGGLKALLSRLEQHASDVVVVDEFIHRDIDRPADYLSLADRLGNHQLFSRKECEALLNERLQVAPRIAAHCQAVADVAMRIGQALNLAGFNLNLHLIHSAALVHDVARGSPNHAHRGAKLLRDMDMALMADIVETHMEMAVDEGSPIREAEVVFLADKLVQEDHLVGLDKRFHQRLHTCTGSPRARESARRRFEAAHMLSGRIEAIIDRPLKMLLQENLPTSG